MGHSEMLLAVAGANTGEIKKLTQQLVAGDWSVFSPAERLAFQFAQQDGEEASEHHR